MHSSLAILSISGSGKISSHLAKALAAIDRDRLVLHTHNCETRAESVRHPVMEFAREKADAYFSQQDRPVDLHLVHVRSLAQLPGFLAESKLQDTTVGMVFHDLTDSEEDLLPAAIIDDLNAVYRELAAQGIKFMRSSFSDVVFKSAAHWKKNPFQSSINYRVRVLHDEQWVAQADLLSQFMNYFQHTFTNRLALRRLKSSDNKIPLGDEVVKFLKARCGKNWSVGCYTGSIVSSLIKQIEEDAMEEGAHCLRGPNEHSLACGAFINWKLYKTSHLIVLTSAMLDELKGTLANMKQVGAKGFIICADTKENKWFGFQSTVGTDGDVRHTLAARNIPYVYMDSRENMKEKLEQAFSFYDSTEGPVVIIATQEVLETREPLPEPVKIAVTRREEAGSRHDETQVQRVIDLVNKEKKHILWQCGALDKEEASMVIGIAEKAGIALCDALSAPGHVSRFVDGRRVENYLGVLGQYGTNQEVYEFLYEDGKLADKTTQTVFFLKGKIGQIDSPFSDGAHEQKLHIVQVNKNPAHIASFADVPLAMTVKKFLLALEAGLDVDADVLAMRRARIRQHNRQRDDVLSQIPSFPMTPNYFYSQLNQILERKIEREGYQYIGMYDVGHCGTLATRNLSRTGPSYSGWYGRALMGDALQATGMLAFTAHTNVLAFVGDGAKNITPDILPGLIENIQNSANEIRHNITIFFFYNNALSIINSYQERIMFKPGGRQMEVCNHPDFTAMQEWSRILRGVEINSIVLPEFDAERVASILDRKPSVNFVHVPLTNNNDGISIVDVDLWQYGAKRKADGISS